MTASAAGRLGWLLNDLVARLANVRYAVVLSTDGLPLARCDALTADEADHFCAMASSIHSLARSAGNRFGVGGVRQTVIELETGVLFVTSAGQNACLALLTTEAASLGMIAYEMNQTVQRVGSALSTAERRLAIGSTDG